MSPDRDETRVTVTVRATGAVDAARLGETLGRALAASLSAASSAVEPAHEATERR